MFLSIFIASNVLLMLIYSCVVTLLSRHLPRDGGAMLLHVLGEPAGRSKTWENTDASSRGFWWPLVEQTNIYQLTSYKLWVEKISKIKTIVCFAVLCQLWEVSFPSCMQSTFLNVCFGWDRVNFAFSSWVCAVLHSREIQRQLFGGHNFHPLTVVVQH